MKMRARARALKRIPYRHRRLVAIFRVADEILSEMLPITEASQFAESSRQALRGERATVRVGLPTVYWRAAR